ncbi:hypothetical protein [Streptomyces sp. S.PB5]|uniref:hypothetical protein n=1 Tax=Streptomyces sp. S.PB5 TaxID=3020844 RepID=UPI0025B17B7A|nr:hypothetical protein [Streptomyces sp. S.PB5]MDN3021373.1 hypothetical protein [Streptomyces sp. S.PB5]
MGDVAAFGGTGCAADQSPGHSAALAWNVVSAVLANLFMHYAFDLWLTRTCPGIQSERYEEVGLRLHPDKTRIVYCKDGKRRGSSEHTSFTFLGYTFRARSA